MLRLRRLSGLHALQWRRWLRGLLLALSRRLCLLPQLRLGLQIAPLLGIALCLRND